MSYDYPQFLASPDPGVYLSDSYLVVDFETTNLEKGSALNRSNGLLLARWRLGPSHPRAGVARDVGHWGSEFDQELLANDIGLSDFIIAHYTKFELAWLKRIGVDLRKVLPYCTLIGEKVLAGNRKVDLSLEATATRRGLGGKKSTVSALIHNGVCPSEIPPTMLETYCEQDVSLTESIFLQQRKELSELALLPVAFTRNIVTPVIADIEDEGMTLDPPRVFETWAEYALKYNKAEEAFLKETDGINFKSGKQVREFLYDKPGAPVPGEAPKRGLGFEELTDRRGTPDRTPAGNPKTDKHTLASLVATTKEQKRFKKLLLQLAKLRVPMQNLNKMKAICEVNPNDPRVFATFNQTVTDTDRLSSTGRGDGGFQFHNFDRAFKRLFRARHPGSVMCEADAPQLEFRVAAFLGNDATAKEDIQTGVDVHANSAQAIFGRVTPELRQDAKPKTFKPLYGGNSGTPGELRYYDFFRKRYDGIYRTQQSWAVRVARDKFLVTPWGHRFYWPGARVTSSGYIEKTTQIFNYPIQSFATADIIPITLVLLWHRVARFGDKVRIVNTIHDSVVMESEPELLDSLVESIVSSFTQDIYHMLESIYGIKFDVPLGVGIKHGEYWGSGGEIKVSGESPHASR